MSLIQAISRMPGVLAAGEYSYRGDRFSFAGELTDEFARMASIMCRATTMASHMQVDMMKSLGSDCGCAPARGWMVRGQRFSVCVIGNVFCFLDHSAANVNEVMRLLIEQVPQQAGQLV
jgi:roadblock/LC7 domain-containing protein